MQFNNINIRYKDHIIFKNFDINFEMGKVNCIIGKSGCGKTTLLNYISDDLIRRNIKFSYIFQSNNLIPWKSVYKNILVGFKNNYDKEEYEEEINKLLNKVGLQKFVNSYPYELSGGMKQKVNIVRALISRSNDIIIMDEPFKSLDIKSKEVIFTILRNICEERKVTIILVTHNVEEIQALADITYLLGQCPIKVIDIVKKNNIEKIIKKFKESVDDN